LHHRTISVTLTARKASQAITVTVDLWRMVFYSDFMIYDQL